MDKHDLFLWILNGQGSLEVIIENFKTAEEVEDAVGLCYLNEQEYEIQELQKKLEKIERKREKATHKREQLEQLQKKFEKTQRRLRSAEKSYRESIRDWKRIKENHERNEEIGKIMIVQAKERLKCINRKDAETNCSSDEETVEAIRC